MFEVQQIVIKHLRKEALSAEESIVLRRLQASKDGRELIKNFADEKWVSAQMAQLHGISDDGLWQKVRSLLEKEGVRPVDAIPPLTVVPMHGAPARRLWRGAAAAAVILLAGGAVYWGLHSSGKPSKPENPVIAAIPAGLPGGNKAMLTLSDGRQIDLDSAANGAVADQGNVTISKLADGQLAYNALNEKPAASSYNTLTTPRAGQFALALPDGTKVWLNNASSLRYPVNFSGDSRAVELKGEGYFEVAKNPKMPFKVKIQNGAAGVDGGTVEVLGTAFNIMAYSDENTQRTTLVQGSVQIEQQGHQQVLKPKEQSVTDSEGHVQILRDVDVSEVTAWKNGYFHFDKTTLPQTLRQLARWYDVDVEYKGVVTEQTFNFKGKIQRNLPLSIVLKGLESEHIHFQLEGRKLLVLP